MGGAEVGHIILDVGWRLLLHGIFARTNILARDLEAAHWSCNIGTN